MRSGKLQAADSLSRRIGERIARCNASYFSGKKPTSRELWCKVRKVMGKELRGDVAGTSNFTATMLNDHYARISTDPHYDCPTAQTHCHQCRDFLSEQQIFHILHKGCPHYCWFRWIASMVPSSCSTVHQSTHSSSVQPIHFVILHPRYLENIHYPSDSQSCATC